MMKIYYCIMHFETYKDYTLNEDINKIVNQILSNEDDFIKSMEMKKRRENRQTLGITIFIIFLVAGYYLKISDSFTMMIGIFIFSIVILLNVDDDTKKRNEGKLVIVSCLLMFFSYSYYSKNIELDKKRNEVSKICYQALNNNPICQEIDNILAPKDKQDREE